MPSDPRYFANNYPAEKLLMKQYQEKTSLPGSNIFNKRWGRKRGRFGGDCFFFLLVNSKKTYFLKTRIDAAAPDCVEFALFCCFSEATLL